MKLKITNVDMNGYLGRDNHPEPSDIGIVVTVVKTETWYWNGEKDANVNEPVIGEDGRPFGDALTFLANPAPGDWEGIETCFTVVTPDGRLLELMEHEVEFILGRLKCRICNAAIVCARCANDSGDYETAVQG